MNQVRISQLWGRAWNLFKANWLLLLGMFILVIVVNFIPFVGSLFVWVFIGPAWIRAGFVVARQGQSSFGEAFGDLLTLLKIFAYNLVLSIIPLGMIVGGYGLIMASISSGMGDIYGEDYGSTGSEKLFSGAGGILVVAGIIIYLILWLFSWAGPYAILSRGVGVFGAIVQSSLLTTQNFRTVFLAVLSVLGITILGFIPCGLGLLVVIPMCNVFMPLLYLELTRSSPTPSLS